jgi:hypothetical protein
MLPEEYIWNFSDLRRVSLPIVVLVLLLLSSSSCSLMTGYFTGMKQNYVCSATFTTDPQSKL